MSSEPYPARLVIEHGKNPPDAAAAAALTRSWAMAGLACLTVAFWAIVNPFRGLADDSVLYAVLALARLHPAALGHDFFVRFATQDRYTIFSPLFAAGIRTLGLGRAAAALTLAAHLAFFAAAWLLARRLMSARTALLAVGFLAVLPSSYGANAVFSYVEPLLTPRMPAEALALAGIAAALQSRHLLAGACLLVALLLHPIIGAAGVGLWIVLVPGSSRTRLTTAAALVAAAVIVLLSLLGKGPFHRFDGVWLGLLRERPTYLFVTQWPWQSWIENLVRIAVLVAGAFVARGNIRRLCIGALIVAAAGLGFTVLECDLLHVVLAAQMQTWRWLWLTGALSVLLAPPILMDCWRAGHRARGIAVLIVALAAAVLALESRPPPPDLILQASRHYLSRIALLQTLALNGLLPATLLALTAWAIDRCTRRSALLLAALGAALLLAVTPYALAAWNQDQYPPDRYRAFAPWREAIPQGAEVLWPDPPPTAWFELGRSSYWSLYQMAGMVFSRDLSVLGDFREQQATAVMPTLGRVPASGTHYPPAPALTLAQAVSHSPCTVHDITWFASWRDLGPTPYPAVVPDAARPRDVLRLYRCVRH